ncbi:hypothetical protein ANCCAN_04944 [Ancylostoma caninum]|uniref:Uncharacterized protein n=1 Tax=Ancylostoma caninum TaxID=29170 RepID=A0A368GX81_ANCCA|nr:hypothetical protein ANCCAN_04944 [Ancylostoma caninum]
MVHHVQHLERNASECTVLNLNTYLDHDIVRSDKFFDFIKNIGEYNWFMLRGSDLRKFTDLNVIKVHDGAHVSIIENTHLEKLPKFEWEDGAKVVFTVVENHNLDTTELLEEIKARKLEGSRVQRPFGEFPAIVARTSQNDSRKSADFG